MVYLERWDPSCAKKDPKRTDTVATVEIRTNDDETGKASALVTTTDNVGKALNIFAHF